MSSSGPGGEGGSPNQIPLTLILSPGRGDPKMCTLKSCQERYKHPNLDLEEEILHFIASTRGCPAILSRGPRSLRSRPRGTSLGCHRSKISGWISLTMASRPCTILGVGRSTIFESMTWMAFLLTAGMLFQSCHILARVP